MPGQKKHQKRSRRGRRAKAERPTGDPFTLWLGPPNRDVVRRLVYVQTGGFSEASAGAGAFYTFSLNGVYDPDVTSTGKQPIGFDQLATMYYQFRVVKTDVEVSFLSNTPSPNSLIVGMYAGYTGFLPSDPDSWEVQRNSKVAFLAPAGVGGNKVTIRRQFKPNEVLGISRQSYLSEADYAGNSSMNPQRQAYLQLFLRSSAGAGVTGAAYYFVRIAYTVVCSNPVALPMS